MKISKPLILMAAVTLAGFLSLGGAQAANVATGSAPLPAIQKAQESNVQTASHRKRYWRHRGPRASLWFGFGGFGNPYYRPYYSYRPYYYGFPPNYYGYRPYYRPAGGSHVRWCFNRYRSYDPRSNTFMGYDGYRHRCKSPYRY